MENISDDAYLSFNGTIHNVSPTQIFSGICFVFLMMFGIVFNAAVILTFFKNRHLQTPTNSLLIGLAGNDMLMVVFGMPLIAASCLHGSWLFGGTMCITYAFITTVGGVTSTCILTAIAIDRFFVVTKRHAANTLTRSKIMLVLLVCLLIGLFWAVLPLCGVGAYAMETSRVSCGPDWQNTFGKSSSYNIAIFVFVFVIPVSIIIFCYGKIIKMARGNRIQVSHAAGANNFREIKLSMTICFVIGSHIVAWSPYAVLSIWTMMNDISSLPEVVAILPPLIAKSSAAWNPLVYVYRNRDFRKAFWFSFVRPDWEGNSTLNGTQTPANMTQTAGISRIAGNQTLRSTKRNSQILALTARDVIAETSM